MTNKQKDIMVIVFAIAAFVIVVSVGLYITSKSKVGNVTNIIDKVAEEINEKTDLGKKEESRENTEESNAIEETSVVELSNKGARPSLLSKGVTLEKSDIVANTAEYSVNPDLSDIYNLELFWIPDDAKKLLSDNLFYVSKPDGYYEFFEMYETNRYYYEPNFVTVDSLMHTYHLYFSHLLKTVEKTELAFAVKIMSEELLEESNKQYEQAKGTAYENAAKRNVEFFAVAVALSGGEVKAAFDVSDVVEAELTKISRAEGIDDCEITGSKEDYTQYEARGYYKDDELLEAYFKTMMWYGRIQFNAADKDMTRSAILMNVALNNSGITEWKDIYDITSFFVGVNDDLGYYEYYPLIQEVYGENVKLSDILDDKGLDDFCKKAASLRLPEINSIPIKMGEDNVIPGFRLMGQRFTVDASIMQKLIYSCVDKNSNEQLRMLPDVLDVAAALGSDTAYDLLNQHGDMDYKNYKNNLDELVDKFSQKKSDEYFETSLYGNWLSTLRPLLKEKGKGYPSFMQSSEWAKKDIETFAGSYTELKHDTVLYAKQVMAEMGSGDIPEYDDRGYVQPEPEVYARFAYLADATRTGLEERNRINATDVENLKKLSDLARSLKTMSEKELQDEVLTDEEYDLIREYGGVLEHFWYEVMKADTGDSEINTEKYQAALCIDVATDPNGAVLEMATGQPCVMYVVVNVDGKKKIAKGMVYSFYQFEWPINDRLTDSKWRQLMGFEPEEDGFYNGATEKAIDIPWWTKSYSYVYTW